MKSAIREIASWSHIVIKIRLIYALYSCSFDKNRPDILEMWLEVRRHDWICSCYDDSWSNSWVNYWNWICLCISCCNIPAIYCRVTVESLWSDKEQWCTHTQLLCHKKIITPFLHSFRAESCLHRNWIDQQLHCPLIIMKDMIKEKKIKTKNKYKRYWNFYHL